MFYSHQILARKGPLGVIWLAAHLDRRLRRQQIFQADIPDSVEAILFSTEPRALRLSGQLLLGVVRIYSRKVGYLYTDCNDAMGKLRQVYHVGAAAQVELGPDKTVAPLAAITLPEHYEDLDYYADAEAAEGRQSQYGSMNLETLEEEEFNLFGGAEPTLEGLRSRFDDFGEDQPEKLRSVAAEGPAESNLAFEMEEQVLMTPSRTPVPAPVDEEVEMELPVPEEHLEVPDMEVPELDAAGLVTPGRAPSTPASGVLPSITPPASGNNNLGSAEKPREEDGEEKEEAGDEENVSPTKRKLSQRRSAGPRKRRQLQVDEYLVISKKDMRDALNDTSDIVRERRLPSRKRFRPTQRLDATSRIMQPAYEPGNAEVRALYDKCLKVASTKSVAEAKRRQSEQQDAAVPEMIESPERRGLSPARYDEAEFPEFENQIPQPGELEVPSPNFEAEEHDLNIELRPASLGGDALPAQIPPQTLREALAAAADDGTDEDVEVDNGVRGLSTRTRKVAGFMRATFVEAGGSSTKTKMHLSNVLKEGSTKTEAARMLFEMLALTTKGYMQLDQKEPNEDIVLRPTTLMMQTEVF